MKFVKVKEELCIGCRKCEIECSKTFFQDDSGDKAVIKVSGKEGKFTINVCSQCGACTHICPTQALTVSKTGVVMLNKSKCVQCYACVGFCDTLSIHYFKGVNHPNKCIACGKCVSVCESGAITI